VVKRKRDHLPLKQAKPVQLLSGVLMLASKASSSGFFSCSLQSAHFSAHKQFYLLGKKFSRRATRKVFTYQPGCAQYPLSMATRLPVHVRTTLVLGPAVMVAADSGCGRNKLACSVRLLLPPVHSGPHDSFLSANEPGPPP
jgi:hypothetical protein